MAYAGYRLSDESRAKLLSRFPPKYANVVAHHITSDYLGKRQTGFTPPQPKKIEVIGHSHDEEKGIHAAVVRVDGHEHQGMEPERRLHITLSHGDDARPVHSNDAIKKGWEKLDQPFEITAVPFIGESTAGSKKYGYHVLWHHRDLGSVRSNGLGWGGRELHFVDDEDQSRDYENDNSMTLRFPLHAAGNEREHVWPCDDHWTTTKKISHRHIEYRDGGNWKKLIGESAWHAPSWGDESGEFDRVAKDKGIDTGRLRRAFDRASVGPVDARDFSRLQNTDANAPKKPSVDDVHAMGRAYGGKDSQGVHKALSTGKSLPAPIVLHQPGKDPELVAGNTRMTMARAMGHELHALHVHLGEEIDEDLGEGSTRPESISVLIEEVQLLPLDKGPSYNRVRGTRDRDAGEKHYARYSTHSDRSGNTVDVEYTPKGKDGHYAVDFYTRSGSGEGRTFKGRGNVPPANRVALGLHVGRSLDRFVRTVRPLSIEFGGMRQDPDHDRKNAQYQGILQRIANTHGGRVSTANGPYSVRHRLSFTGLEEGLQGVYLSDPKPDRAQPGSVSFIIMHPEHGKIGYIHGRNEIVGAKQEYHPEGGWKVGRPKGGRRSFQIGNTYVTSDAASKITGDPNRTHPQHVLGVAGVRAVAREIKKKMKVNYVHTHNRSTGAGGKANGGMYREIKPMKIRATEAITRAFKMWDAEMVETTRADHLIRGFLNEGPKSLFDLKAAFGARNAYWISPTDEVHALPNSGTQNGKPAHMYWHSDWAQDPEHQGKIEDHLKVKNADGSIDGLETKNRMLQAGWIKVGGVNANDVSFEAHAHPGHEDRIRKFLKERHPDHAEAAEARGGFLVNTTCPQTGNVSDRTLSIHKERKSPAETSDYARMKLALAPRGKGSELFTQPERIGEAVRRFLQSS